MIDGSEIVSYFVRNILFSSLSYCWTKNKNVELSVIN